MDLEKEILISLEDSEKDVEPVNSDITSKSVKEHCLDSDETNFKENDQLDDVIGKIS